MNAPANLAPERATAQPVPATLGGVSAGRFLARLRRGTPTLARISAGWLILLLALIVLRPFLGLPDPTRSDYNAISLGPFQSGAHWLGTDAVGRDILARLITGAQVSLAVGVGSVVIACIVGFPIGTIAGYFGGKVDRLLSSLIDILLAFPPLIAVIALAFFMGPQLSTIIIGLGIIFTPQVARVSRSATLAFANREFVAASRGTGASEWRTLRREVTPNAVIPVVAYATVLVAVAISAEGGLSFLGLGVPAPQSSWGSMMGEARSELSTAPHTVLIPAAAMFITLLAINFLAEHFGRRFDVKEAAL